MTEEEELILKAQRLLADYESLPLYQHYRSLKESVEIDAVLQKLKKEREELQKSLRFLKPEEKKKALIVAKNLLSEYDNDPKVVYYTSTKEELLALLRPLMDAKL